MMAHARAAAERFDAERRARWAAGSGDDRAGSPDSQASYRGLATKRAMSISAQSSRATRFSDDEHEDDNDAFLQSIKRASSAYMTVAEARRELNEAMALPKQPFAPDYIPPLPLPLAPYQRPGFKPPQPTTVPYARNGCDICSHMANQNFRKSPFDDRPTEQTARWRIPKAYVVPRMPAPACNLPLGWHKRGVWMPESAPTPNRVDHSRKIFTVNSSTNPGWDQTDICPYDQPMCLFHQGPPLRFLPQRPSGNKLLDQRVNWQNPVGK